MTMVFMPAGYGLLRIRQGRIIRLVEIGPTGKVPISSQQRALTAAAAKGIRATVWGIVASAVLAVVKILSGIVGNSYALIADGIESVLDIMSSMVVWGSLRIA